MNFNINNNKLQAKSTQIHKKQLHKFRWPISALAIKNLIKKFVNKNYLLS